LTFFKLSFLVSIFIIKKF